MQVLDKGGLSDLFSALNRRGYSVGEVRAQHSNALQATFACA